MHVGMYMYSVLLCCFLCTTQQYGVNVTTNNVEVVERSQIIWLAVKPHAIGRVLREVTPVVRPDQLIISTAAGIPIKEIEKVRLITKPCLILAWQCLCLFTSMPRLNISE
jgi:ketopantoate reductase